jgi:hypothetical protein
MARRPTRDPYARPAIQTLERLHAELGGKILENKQEHTNLAEQMRHVEAVIKMLDPGYSLRAISVKRRQPNPWFKRGTVYRRAVDALRTATEPLTAREITERVLVAAEVDSPKKAAVADLTGSILSSLRNHVGKGIQRTNEGSPARWQLKEAANRGGLPSRIGIGGSLATPPLPHHRTYGSVYGGSPD